MAHTHTQWNITQPLNGIVPFAETSMDLEIAIQSEVSHKGKKNIYLMHICGIWTDSSDEPISTA